MQPSCSSNHIKMRIRQKGGVDGTPEGDVPLATTAWRARGVQWLTWHPRSVFQMTFPRVASKSLH